MILYKHRALIVFLLLFFRVAAAEETLPTPALNNDAEVFSNTGHFKLLWKAEAIQVGELEYELQRSQDENFEDARTIYKGPDRGSFISGLKNGKYFFRVRALNGIKASDWSSSVKLTVEHHTLKMAFTLFGLGGGVFLFTLIMLIVGVRKTNQES